MNWLPDATGHPACDRPVAGIRGDPIRLRNRSRRDARLWSTLLADSAFAGERSAVCSLFSGGSFGSPRINWDGHEDVKENHGREAVRMDQPVAALIKDLRQRGMLDDTLVLCTSEFGRTPFTQSDADKVGTGRDHNMYGFSIWMAGAGLKHGLAYGATDDIGWKTVDKPVHWYDYHATVLHLLGIDHERLTYYHNGIKRRLTNVHGEVLTDILS